MRQRTRPLRRHRILPAVAVVALASLAAYGVLGTTSDAPLPLPAAPTAGPDAPAEPVRELADRSVREDVAALPGCYGAAPGSTFRYRVVDQLEFALHSQEGGAQQQGAMHAECVVTTTVLDRREDAILVRQQVEALRFVDAAGRTIDGDPIQRHLAAATAAPVLVALDRRGLPTAFGFAGGLDGDQRNFLRGTLLLFAVEAPAAGQREWERTQCDTTGELAVAYAAADAPDEAIAGAHDVVVQRRPLRYLSITGQPELPRHDVAGVARAALSRREGWLRSVRLEETLQLALPLLDFRSTTTRRAEATLLACGHVPAGDATADWRRTTSPVGSAGETLGGYAQAQERDHWRTALQGVTVAQLLDAVRDLLAQQPVDRGALNGAFQQLQQLVQLDDAAAREIELLVQTRGLRDEVAAIAVAALGAAGTPAAQRSLVEIRSRGNVSTDVRLAATVGALQIAAPIHELLDGLVADAAGDADGSASAMMVLGALATRAAGPLADGRQPVEALFAMERAAEQRGGLADWLLAVGNTRTPAAFAAAERNLAHTDAAVRAAALVALRHAPPSRTVPALARALDDADPAVRFEAIRELGRRAEPESRAALRRAADTDPAEALRHHARELLQAGT